MHPGKTGLKDFDLVIVPEHDKNKTPSSNIHYITGCPHRITPQYLQEAKKKWETKFANLDNWLGDLNLIQRKWVYLEPIFSRGALPKEQGRFKKIDDEFLDNRNIIFLHRGNI